MPYLRAAAFVLFIPFGFLLAASARADERPNIVIIMADDMGYSDIGCYGSEINTPNIDKLAENGLRFTQFYNAARCCPTRAALLTGLYPHRAGIGHMDNDLFEPSYRGFLRFQSVTIAEVLREAGYATYMSGKWHVGGYRPHWPVDRGFDRSYTLLSGFSSYYAPSPGRNLVRDNAKIDAPDDWFITDAISDEAAKYIKKHEDDDPFFLYVAYTAPHWPLHAHEEDIAKYRGKYKIGWDALRERRHRRMIELGIVVSHWPLTPRDEKARAWDELSDEEKDEFDLKMAVYAAQIDRMDQGVGRIVEALRSRDKLRNTVIMFLADNGGCAEELNTGGKNAPIGARGSFTSYGLPWANASNTPFRLYKHYVHEGGISTPLIVHWPAVIDPSEKSKAITHEPGHLVDLMATCVDLAETEYPTEYNGHEIESLDGESLVPIFTEGSRPKRKPIFWEHEGNRAVRDGKWKLVGPHGKDWELYDMEADRTEMNNLAGRHPDVVAELAAKYEAWAKDAHVRTWEEVLGKLPPWRGLKNRDD